MDKGDNNLYDTDDSDKDTNGTGAAVKQLSAEVRKCLRESGEPALADLSDKFVERLAQKLLLATRSHRRNKVSVTVRGATGPLDVPENNLLTFVGVYAWVFVHKLTLMDATARISRWYSSEEGAPEHSVAIDISTRISGGVKGELEKLRGKPKCQAISNAFDVALAAKSLAFFVLPPSEGSILSSPPQVEPPSSTGLRVSVQTAFAGVSTGLDDIYIMWTGDDVVAESSGTKGTAYLFGNVYLVPSVVASALAHARRTARVESILKEYIDPDVPSECYFHRWAQANKVSMLNGELTFGQFLKAHKKVLRHVVLEWNKSRLNFTSTVAKLIAF